MNEDRVPLHILMPKSLRQDLRVLAASKGMGMGTYVRLLITEAVKELKPGARKG